MWHLAVVFVDTEESLEAIRDSYYVCNELVEDAVSNTASFDRDWLRNLLIKDEDQKFLVMMAVHI